MNHVLRLLILALFVGLAVPASAQPAQPLATSADAPSTQPATQQMTPPGGDSGIDPFDFKRILTRFEFWLSLLILAFGATVVLVQYSLLRKRLFDANDILKVFGVTLIIVGTLFLIAAGFGDKQIAPAMGLFGTLAGYLLGKASVDPGPKHDDKPHDKGIK